MKKNVILLLTAVLLTVNVFAQAPEKMSYQAVIRNSSDALITNTEVGMQISILQGSASGTAVYVETQTPTSNANGLVSIEIGAGTSTYDFSAIDWSTGTYFIKTETDPEGGTNYTITGVNQLLSVPYALHAKTAESVAGGITETDPVFTAWDKDYADLTNTPTIPTVPTNVSDFTNDANYISSETQNLTQVLTQGNDANVQQIKNIADPTEPQDAATKAYVDELLNILNNAGIEVVDFSASSTDISPGNTVTFTDNSVLEATTWLWDFGDGNTSTDENPIHTYSNEGFCNVSLTVSNGVLSYTKTKNNYIIILGDSFTDSRDGNVYQIVDIGNQIWMAENLKYLPSVVGGGTGSETSPYYYVYGYNGTSVDDAKAIPYYQTYGVLYNWHAAMAACPAGWHLPSDAEWTELKDYISNDGHNGTEGTALKATSGWNNSGNGTVKSHKIS